ncbi:type II secretion system F family protein [Candidatus Jorgensenbacteria bacterium]|nr:type II secretion system F family protein [Candidatus Jorgensenbacteria bacterium]
MQFRYIASQPDGRIVESEMEARNIEDVLVYLGSRRLTPVSVMPVKQIHVGFLGFGKNKVTLTDQIFISKYLSLMLKIGTGLMEAINILIADFSKPAVRAILLEIRGALEQGNPFYSTFARYPRVFSPIYVNLVRAGEAAGNLEQTFEQLTDLLTKQKELKDKIRSALIYPIILLVSSVSILILIVTFALPRVATIFLEGGFDPPTFSRIVFSVGLFLNKIGFYLFGAAVVAIIVFLRMYRTSPVFKKFVVSIVGEIPVIRDVVKKIAIQRFSNVFSSLVKAGLPITEALEITAQTSGNITLKESLLRIAREGLVKGLSIGEAFRREPFFPVVVINLIAISEKAGHLAEVLTTLADFYEKEIDSAVKTLVSFLEPVMLLFIGGIIGLIALSIIIPIYQLTTQF